MSTFQGSHRLWKKFHAWKNYGIYQNYENIMEKLWNLSKLWKYHRKLMEGLLVSYLFNYLCRMYILSCILHHIYMTKGSGSPYQYLEWSWKINDRSWKNHGILFHIFCGNPGICAQSFPTHTVNMGSNGNIRGDTNSDSVTNPSVRLCIV